MSIRTGSSARLKLLLVGGMGLAAGFVLIGWTQRWFTLELTAQGGVIGVDGGTAAPAVGALALAALALVGALALAGPVFRVILGLLGIVLGGLVAMFAGASLGDPVAASAPDIAAATGAGGTDALRALVAGLAVSPWPWIVLVAGVLLGLLALGVILTGPRWPASGRRYRTVRFEDAADGSDPISDWDRLSEGRDPTAP